MVCADKLLQKWEKTIFATVGERNTNLPKCKPTPRKLLSIVDFMLCLQRKIQNIKVDSQQISFGLDWHIFWIHTAHFVSGKVGQEGGVVAKGVVESWFIWHIVCNLIKFAIYEESEWNEPSFDSEVPWSKNGFPRQNCGHPISISMFEFYSFSPV